MDTQGDITHVADVWANDSADGLPRTHRQLALGDGDGGEALTRGSHVVVVVAARREDTPQQN